MRLRLATAAMLLAATAMTPMEACAWTHGAAPLPLVPGNGAGWASATTPEGGTCNNTVGSNTNQCAVPAAVGNPGDYGYSADVIAAFAEVQKQTVDSTQDFFVVAWHAPSAAEYAAGVKSNIDHVSCSSSGSWVTVQTQSVMPGLSGPFGPLYGYKFTVDASKFSDGLQEIRCIAYPTTGKPVVLQGPMPGGLTIPETSLYVNTNSHLTLHSYRTSGYLTYVSPSGTDSGNCTSSASPCKTQGYAVDRTYVAGGNTDVGGAVVCMQAGTYPIGAPTASNTVRTSGAQWTTVQPTSDAPCDGVNSGTVILSGLDTNRFNARYQHYKDIQFGDGSVTSGTGGSPAAAPCSVSVPCSSTYTYARGGGALSALWLDGGKYIGRGQWQADDQPNWISSHLEGVWCTSMEIFSTYAGCRSGTLTKGLYIHDISSEAITNMHVNIGDRVETLASCCGNHPDVWQNTTSSTHTLTGLINYGLAATVSIDAQGPFLDQSTANTYNNVAFVDSAFDNSGTGRYIFLANYTTNNYLIMNSRLIGTSNLYEFSNGPMTNLTAVDSVCSHHIATGAYTLTKYGSATC
jgi:hypothetical protein